MGECDAEKKKEENGIGTKAGGTIRQARGKGYVDKKRTKECKGKGGGGRNLQPWERVFAKL